MQLALFFVVLSAFCAVSYGFPPPKTCQISDSNPKPDWNSIPKASVNLDLAPVDRWTELASTYKVQIAAMVNEFVVIYNFIRCFPLLFSILHYICQ
jgi:hypothetical protein